MGARASWPLLLQNPDIFAGAIIGSGATYDSAEQLSTLFGIPIRNYYGADDEAGLEEASEDTNTTYVSIVYLPIRFDRAYQTGLVERFVISGEQRNNSQKFFRFPRDFTRAIRRSSRYDGQTMG